MSPSKKDNLRIYEQVWRTDPDTVTELKFGAKLTSVDFYSRMKTMTDVFGPCGDGWGYTYSIRREEGLPNGEVLLVCDLSLWYESRSQAISSVGTSLLCEWIKKDGELKLNKNAHKSVVTSATAKAFSMLGMNHDVYTNRWNIDHAADMREYFRSLKAFASCPHLTTAEAIVRSSWDSLACMRAVSEMARCVTTHMTWFTHHLESSHPDWLTNGKPNSKVTFPYCRNLFLKVQRRTGLLHRLMQAYTDRFHWLQTLECLGGVDPYALSEAKFDALLKKIRTDVSGIDQSVDEALEEGRKDAEDEGSVDAV